MLDFTIAGKGVPLDASAASSAFRSAVGTTDELDLVARESTVAVLSEAVVSGSNAPDADFFPDACRRLEAATLVAGHLAREKDGRVFAMCDVATATQTEAEHICVIGKPDADPQQLLAELAEKVTRHILQQPAVELNNVPEPTAPIQP